MQTVMIICYPNRVVWAVRDSISTIASGSDLLKEFNGDYDSLMSCSVTRAAQFVTCKEAPEYIFRKEG